MTIYSNMTKDEQDSWKKSQLKAIREHHSELISDLGVSMNDFHLKMVFYSSKGERVVGIFPNEFCKEKGFYFEIIDRNYEPADSERKVYRVPFNSSFSEEYELTEKGSFLIPIDELRTVNPVSVGITKLPAAASSDRVLGTKKSADAGFAGISADYRNSDFGNNSPAEDAPYESMTIRDFYAIQSGKPVSCKDWLNKLIQSNKH